MIFGVLLLVVGPVTADHIIGQANKTVGRTGGQALLVRADPPPTLPVQHLSHRVAHH